MAVKKDDYSIAKTTIIFNDGHEVEGIGEASQANINEKMTQVRNSLNMMAETRSLNRAIWKEIAGDVWERVDREMAKAVNTAGMTLAEKQKIYDAGRVSFEEVDQVSHERANATDESPVASSPADLEASLRHKIEVCNEADVLIDIDEKLQKSKLYSPKFKSDMRSVISAKVDKLNNG